MCLAATNYRCSVRQVGHLKVARQLLAEKLAGVDGHLGAARGLLCCAGHLHSTERASCHRDDSTYTRRVCKVPDELQQRHARAHLLQRLAVLVLVFKRLHGVQDGGVVPAICINNLGRQSGQRTALDRSRGSLQTTKLRVKIAVPHQVVHCQHKDSHRRYTATARARTGTASTDRHSKHIGQQRLKLTLSAARLRGLSAIGPCGVFGTGLATGISLLPWAAASSSLASSPSLCRQAEGSRVPAQVKQKSTSQEPYKSTQAVTLLHPAAQPDALSHTVTSSGFVT